MSEKLYVRPRLPERRSVTRRTAMRGAAWTAPAITVAVASPNIAANSGDQLPPPPPPPIDAEDVELTTVDIDKDGGNPKPVTWKFTITNNSDTPVTSILLSFAGCTWPMPSPAQAPAMTASVPEDDDYGSWDSYVSGAYGTATWTGTLAKGQTLNVTAKWLRDKQNKGGAGNATVTLNGATTLSLGPANFS